MLGKRKSVVDSGATPGQRVANHITDLYGRGGIAAREAGDMMDENAAARVKSCDVLKPKMRAAAITR
eukprot:5441573-Amphidinium_carterae.1